MSEEEPRRGRPRDDRVDAVVIKAAHEELIAVGPERFSMRAVARRAGVARASLQLRWSDSECLMADALALTAPPLQLSDNGSLESDLQQAVAQICERMSSPGLQLLVRIVADGTTRRLMLHRLQDQILEPAKREMIRAFERAAGRGEIPVDGGFDWLAEFVIGGIYMRITSDRDLKPPDLGEQRRLVEQFLYLTRSR